MTIGTLATRRIAAAVLAALIASNANAQTTVCGISGSLVVCNSGPSLGDSIQNGLNALANGLIEDAADKQARAAAAAAAEAAARRAEIARAHRAQEAAQRAQDAAATAQTLAALEQEDASAAEENANASAEIFERLRSKNGDRLQGDCQVLREFCGAHPDTCSRFKANENAAPLTYQFAVMRCNDSKAKTPKAAKTASTENPAAAGNLCAQYPAMCREPQP